MYMLMMSVNMEQTPNVIQVHQVLLISLRNEQEHHGPVVVSMDDQQVLHVQHQENYHQYVVLQIKPIQMVLQTMEQIPSVILDLQHHQPLHSQPLVKP